MSLTARQKNARIKAIVLEISGAKVQSASFSPSGFLHIEADHATAEQKKVISEKLVAEHLVGTYWPDLGPGSYNDDGTPYRCPNLSWDRNPYRR